jgi:hypothetical protein
MLLGNISFTWRFSSFQTATIMANHKSSSDIFETIKWAMEHIKKIYNLWEVLGRINNQFYLMRHGEHNKRRVQ